MNAVAIASLEQKLNARRSLPPPDARRALRRQARVSVREIAEAVGRSRQTVALWETGAIEPRGEALIAYAEVMRLLDAAASEELGLPVKASP